MLSFSIVQTIILGVIGGPTEYVKIIVCTIEKLSIPLDRARRAVVGTLIGTLGTLS